MFLEPKEARFCVPPEQSPGGAGAHHRLCPNDSLRHPAAHGKLGPLQALEFVNDLGQGHLVTLGESESFGK